MKIRYERTARRMKRLFVETKNGKAPIPENLAEKYDLKQGERSPFTDARIVGADGDTSREVTQKEREGFAQKPHPDERDREDGTTLTTSEILDFAQGADSAENGFQESGSREGENGES